MRRKGYAVSLVLLMIVSAFSNQITATFAQSEEPPKIIYDNDGIPLVYYGELGYRRNPVTASFALTFYHDNYVQTGNLTKYQYMINTANWLVVNAKDKGGYSVHEYDFDFEYNMTNPWRSAMASGLVIQSLIKPYHLTQNSTYLQTMDQLLAAFFVDVKDGGITHKSEEGWWYEEYSDEGGKNPRVLSGMLYSLLALHDYYVFSRDPDALSLFKKGVLSLRNNLATYDGDGYSFYSIGQHSNAFYHQVNIDLLKKLFTITNDPILKDYADQWECYNAFKVCNYIKTDENPNQQSAITNTDINNKEARDLRVLQTIMPIGVSGMIAVIMIFSRLRKRF